LNKYFIQYNWLITKCEGKFDYKDFIGAKLTNQLVAELVPEVSIWDADIALR